MSQDRRPPPIQPPVTNTYANSMAQAVHPPKLPTLNNFTGYANGRSPPPHLLPAFNGPSLSDRLRSGERLPPIQLPPLTRSQPRSTDRLLSISNLLSHHPESPGRSTNPELHPPSRAPPPPTYSPASGYSSSPYSSSPQLHPQPRTSRHYVDQPPLPHAGSQTAHVPPYPHHPDQDPQGQWRDQPPDRSRRSPLPHRQIDRMYYTPSSGPSPSAPAKHLLPASRLVSKPPPLNYTLNIRQQPIAARACGFGERDRRVVDPPPILELKITSKATGQPEQDNGCILALHCTLLSDDGSDETEVPPTQEGMSSTRRLMGTIVASPYQAKDELGVAGTFFVFPDLSCRSPGKYRLRFKLLRVDPATMVPGGVSPSVATVVSDVFTVYTAKDFPGMRASSALLKALRRQGLNVGVKKGSDARKGKGKTKKEESSSDEEGDTSEEDSGSSSEASPKTTTKRKGKRRKTASR